MIEWVSISTVIAVTAIAFTVLIWIETRRQRIETEKQRLLLEKIVKSLPYTESLRGKKNHTVKHLSQPGVISQPLNPMGEERKRLKIELEKEKLQWQKNKDIAKGIAWIVERLSEPEDDYNDE